MIDIKTLAQRITDGLNEKLTDTNTAFVIMADGGNFIPDVKKHRSNQVQRYINGEAEILDSALTPINGILVSTQTVGVSVLVQINGDFEQSVASVRTAISEYTASAITDYIDGYMVTMYGTQPEVGSRQMRQGYGDSVDYNFTCFFTIVENGVNSSQQNVLFESYRSVTEGATSISYEQVPFTSLTVSRVPIADGGAFSDSNGSAWTWANSTALQISMVVPALTDSVITQAFFEYLLTGEVKEYRVGLKLSTVDEIKFYSMRFDVGNISAETINNVGMTINLVEVLPHGE